MVDKASDNSCTYSAMFYNNVVHDKAIKYSIYFVWWTKTSLNFIIQRIFKLDLLIISGTIYSWVKMPVFGTIGT